MKLVIVASGLGRAQNLAEELGAAKAYVCSPRSIQKGRGRGVVADAVLVDESAWPLDEHAQEILSATLIGSGGQMYTLTRVVADGATGD